MQPTSHWPGKLVDSFQTVEQVLKDHLNLSAKRFRSVALGHSIPSTSEKHQLVLETIA